MDDTDKTVMMNVYSALLYGLVRKLSVYRTW